MTISLERAYPVLHIDDYDKAKNYYVEFLGFDIDFEWRHEEGFPVYMGISRGDLALHLNEHGDLVGQTVYFLVESVHDFLAELKDKRRDVTEEPVDQAWGTSELDLRDPFDNQLVFASPTPEERTSAGRSLGATET